MRDLGMEWVILEKRFDPPTTPSLFPSQFSVVAPCFKLHRAKHHRAHVALDGTRVICLFEAPDAESLRIALNQSRIPFQRAWSATIHGPEGAAIDSEHEPEQAVMVERTFAAPVVFEDLKAAGDAVSWCLETHRVRYLRSYFSRDRRRMLCLYRAPDAEAVRQVQLEAKLPFDCAWPMAIIDDD